MFVHARSELSDSPEAFRLLDQIRALWNEADAFTAAVSTGPSSRQAMEAGALVLPDLEEAFDRVRGTFGVLPGGAPRTAVNFQAMSRTMAVLRPLVSEGLRQTATSLVTPAGSRQRELALLRAEARGIARAVQALRSARTGTGDRTGLSPELDRDFEVLAQLALGLERIAVPWSDDRDIASSVRPLRSQAEWIDFEARSGRFPSMARGYWRSIRGRIDAIADDYQLPRDVVVSSPVKRLARKPQSS